MMGPLTGAEARAYRQPPTAARAVPSATSPRMTLYRRGCATAFPVLLDLVDGGFCEAGFRRFRVDEQQLAEERRRAGLVAPVQRQHAERVERLAPRRIGGGSFLVPRGGLAHVASRLLYFTHREHHVRPCCRRFSGVRERTLGCLGVALCEERRAQTDHRLAVRRIGLEQVVVRRDGAGRV